MEKQNDTFKYGRSKHFMKCFQLASVQGFKNQKTSKALAASFSATIAAPLCPC